MTVFVSLRGCVERESKIKQSGLGKRQVTRINIDLELIKLIKSHSASNSKFFLPQSTQCKIGIFLTIYVFTSYVRMKLKTTIIYHFGILFEILSREIIAIPPPPRPSMITSRNLRTTHDFLKQKKILL